MWPSSHLADFTAGCALSSPSATFALFTARALRFRVVAAGIVVGVRVRQGRRRNAERAQVMQGGVRAHNQCRSDSDASEYSE